MARLWSTWIWVWCWGVIAFGALLVTAAIPPLDGAARLLLVTFGGGTVDQTVLDLPIARFGIGLQGALSIGWGLTMLALADAARTAGAPLWRALTIALSVWYVVDSAISVATGFWINAVSNTLLIVGFLVPVVASGCWRTAK